MSTPRSRLRPFQLDTVRLVNRSFWQDDGSARRFLVADEVGLGKTLIARGIIQEGMSWAKHRHRPFRVVYLCANTALAQQNRQRLFHGLSLDIIERDRLTMLADRLPRPGRSAAVALTPRTSFHLNQRLGMAPERALLLATCRAARWPGTRSARARNVFLGNKAVVHFDQLVGDMPEYIQGTQADQIGGFDRRVIAALRSDPRHLRKRYAYLLKLYPQHNSPGDADARADFIRDLRHEVSHAVLQSLDPDLVILDEFQRFRYLIDDAPEQEESLTSELDADECAARNLARDLVKSQARILLLSATPFKPFTRAEDEIDHHTDFTAVMHFLLKDPATEARLGQALETRRAALLAGNRRTARTARGEAESIMRQVISRHERVTATTDGDSMLRTRGADPMHAIGLDPEHIRDAWSWIRLSKALGQRDPLALWSSAPYAMHFLDEYQLADRLIELRRTRKGRAELAQAMAGCRFAQLPSRGKLRTYATAPKAHPGLAWLLDETIESGWWNMPWLPPSLPYWELRGPFAGKGAVTKHLIFSNWRAVPRSLASLLSYAAEYHAVHSARRSRHVRSSSRPHDEDAAANDSWWMQATSKPVQAFRFYTHQKPQWSLLTLAYPSRILAEVGAGIAAAHPKPLDDRDAFTRVRAQVIRLMAKLPKGRKRAKPDRRWFGLAPVLLDLFHGGIETFSGDPLPEPLQPMIRLLAEVESTIDSLGAQPTQLVDELARMSLASPAVCARRSLMRCGCHTSDISTHAARIAVALARYLEKRPHVVAIKADYGAPLWRGVLMRSLDGCFQAVLDEQMHLLASDGLESGQIVDDIVESLELRPAMVEATRPPHKRDMHRDHHHFPFRTHFAVRFGAKESVEGEGDESEVERLRRVRSAFNAPWWPFVLATTSIGQEGLDFHRWCSSVVHWNLPWNPVDLEQREGRVHRYRNLAVRRNLVDLKRRTSGTTGPQMDPWTALFESVKQKHRGMIPDWLLPGQSKIERITPMLPMSQDQGHYTHLCQLLSRYRALLGQPRQEELYRELDEPMRRRLEQEAFDLAPRC